MIRLDRLSRSFGATPALEEVSFEVPRGEVMGLLGPNGAGKTTCLRVITCFVPPTAGTVIVDGLDVRRDSRAVRSRIGYLPEGVPLYPDLRVCELLGFRAGLLGLSRACARREVDRVMERCSLTAVRRQVVRTLSRGYRQRVGLATALIGAPPVLVLDEPTVGLDPNQVREVRRLIQDLGGDHTVLVSSHVLPEVEAICARAAIINRGRMVVCSPVAALREGGGTVRVTVRAPQAETERVLAAIAGVDRIELVHREGESLSWRLHGEEVLGGSGRERVAVALAGAGLALQELRRESSSLEDVFARLTDEGGKA